MIRWDGISDLITRNLQSYADTLDVRLRDLLTEILQRFIAGEDRLTVLEAGDYAGIGLDSNAVATTIQAAEIPTLVSVFLDNMPESVSNGDYANNQIIVGASTNYHVDIMGSFKVAAVNKECEIQGYQISSVTTAITSITNADPAVVTKVGHGLTGGERVFITGVATMTEINDQIYKVVRLNDDTFSLDAMDDTDIDATGYAGAGTGGTFALANRLVNGCQECVSANKIYNATDSTIGALTLGYKVMAFILNEDSGDNVTVKYCHLKIHKA